MNEGPSKYAGLEAVAVLAAGLLIVSFSLPVERHPQVVNLRWTAALMLAFGLFAMLISIRGMEVSNALVASVAAFVFSGLLFFSAIRSEITGKAIYHRNFLAHRGWRTEP